jgi:hypothetical protein
VREYALRETTMERLRSLAACVRRALHESTIAREERVLPAAEELDALASELEDEELVLEPASAVACARLFSDATVSPLLNASPTEELRSRIAQIRAGFAPVSAPVARAWPPAKRRSNRGRSKKRTPKRRSWAR